MREMLLIVEKDTEKFEEQYIAWIKCGITLVQAYSMQEAIERLTHEKFVTVGINGDNVNYLSQLRIMRDITKLPIHILTSNYTYEKECEALALGANVY